MAVAGALQNACVKSPAGASIAIQSICLPCCALVAPCRNKVYFGFNLPYAYGGVSFGWSLTPTPSADSDFLYGVYYAGSAGVSSYAAPAYGACSAGTLYYVSSLPSTPTNIPITSPYLVNVSGYGLGIDLYGMYEAGIVGSSFSLYLRVFSRSATSLAEINTAISAAVTSTPCLSCANAFYCSGGSGGTWQVYYGEQSGPCTTFNTPTTTNTTGPAVKSLSGQSISYSPATFPELTISNAASIPLYCRFDINLLDSMVVVGQEYYLL